MPGLLIALEGIDGSGKGTQAALLHQQLIAAGVKTALLSFPRYQQTAFGLQIGRFLNGDFGSLDQVHPLLASLLFAGDRFESRELLLKALAEHEIVLCDRYVASNIAHQAAKRTGAERRELIQWIEQLEFEIYRLPRPNLTLWLNVPVVTAQELITRKTRRDYTDKTADLQEADGTYLQQVFNVYAELAAKQPAWQRIECVSRDAEAERSAPEASASQLTQLRTVDEIALEVFNAVKKISRHKFSI